MYAVRDPLYRQVAHSVIETGRPSVSSLVNSIVAKLEHLDCDPPISSAGL